MLQASEMHFLGQVTQSLVLLNQNNQILLVKMNLERGGLWQLPGGRINVGENWEDALRREIFEEVGIAHFDLLGVVLVDNYISIMCGPKYAVCFYGFVKTPVISLSSEHIAYHWINSLTELADFVPLHKAYQEHAICKVFTNILNKK